MICKRGGFIIQRHNELRDLEAQMLNLLIPQQMYRQHENEKKRMYAIRVMKVEEATFTPLVFTATGVMAPECQVYHKRLAELLSVKKGEDDSTTMSWIRTRISFAILQTSLLCLRGSRSMRRVNLNRQEMDVERGLSGR